MANSPPLLSNQIGPCARHDEVNALYKLPTLNPRRQKTSGIKKQKCVLFRFCSNRFAIVAAHLLVSSKAINIIYLNKVHVVWSANKIMDLDYT